MDFSPELITQLGSSIGIFALSIFFIKSFIGYQKDSLDALIEEMRKERRQTKEIMDRELDEFKLAVQKIDARLEYIERALDRR